MTSTIANCDFCSEKERKQPNMKKEKKEKYFEYSELDPPDTDPWS